jgi:hypothetical protein
VLPSAGPLFVVELQSLSTHSDELKHGHHIYGMDSGNHGMSASIGGLTSARIHRLADGDHGYR